MREKGDSVIQLQSHKGGKPTEGTVGKQKTPHTSVLTCEDAKVMQGKNNLTQTQMKNILADYRTVNGRHSVEPFIMENILQSKRELKGYFSSELVDFLKKDPDSPVDYDLDPQPMVYCHNLEGQITKYLAP